MKPPLALGSVVPRLALLGLVLVVAGCGSDRTGRADVLAEDTRLADAVDDSPDAVDGAEVDDETTAADGDDARDGEVVFVDKNPRCVVEAAMLTGRLAVATRIGLAAGPVGWTTPTLDTPVPVAGEPRHPTFWRVAGGRRLVVARAGACDITVLADGAALWAFAVADAVCDGFAVAHDADGHAPALLVPVVEAGAGRVVVLDADGVPTATAPLPDAVAASPARLPRTVTAAGSGSHWLVGGDARVAVITVGDDLSTASVVDDTPTSGPVVSLFALDGARAGATLRAPGAPSSGFGQVLALLDVDRTGATPALSTAREVPLGATLLAPPVATGSCRAVGGAPGCEDAPGDAIVVVGGQGFARGYRFADGAEAWTAPTPATVTGLAFGDNGWLYGSGSHWLTGDGWSVWSRAPDDNVTVLAGDPLGDTRCASSPLVDTDGAVVVAHAADGDPPSLTVIASPAGGLGVGWARASGDNAGTAAPLGSGDRCPDGSDLAYLRPTGLAEGALGFVMAVAAAPAGDIVMAGASEGLPWLGATDALGRPRWSRTFTPPGIVEAITDVAVDDTRAVSAYTLGIGGPTFPLVTVALADGAVTSVDVDSGVDAPWPTNVELLDAGEILVVGSSLTGTSGPSWWTRLDSAGAPLASGAVTLPTLSVAGRVVRHPAGGYAAVAGDLIQGSGPTGYVARLDADLVVTASVPITVDFTGGYLTVLPGGDVAVVLETAGGATGWIYDAELTATPATFDLPTAPRGMLPIGSELLVAGPDRWTRLSRGGAIAETTLVPAGWQIEATVGVPGGRAAALAPTPLAGGRAVGRFTVRGELACEAQGACGQVDCDDGASCTIAVCGRADGACASSSLPFDSPCGPGQTCQPSDVCGP